MLNAKMPDSASATSFSGNVAGANKGKTMNDFLILVAVLVGWFVLNAWVLPKFGVKT